MRRHGYTITVEADASLDDFDIEDIVDYLKEQGYYVATEPKLAGDPPLRFPDPMPIEKYVEKFIALNGLKP